MSNIFNYCGIITIIMKIQEGKSTQQNAYLSKLLTLNSNKAYDASRYIQQSTAMIKTQIEDGELGVSHKKQIQLQAKRLKNDSYKNQIEHINRELLKNHEMYEHTKRQLLHHKKTETEEDKVNNQVRQRQVQENIKKWTQLQKQLKERREILEETKREREAQQEQRLRRQHQEKIEFQKAEKKKIIEQRLRELEENRQKRQEILKQAHTQVKHLNPKYLQIEKKFRQLENQIRFQEEIAKKNHKLSLKIDHEAIKQHEKAYQTLLNQRQSLQKSPRSDNSSTEAQREQMFNQFFCKDESKTQLEREKAKRRREYQQKVKQIPVTIDQAKKIQVEIKKDKGKNKIKYNFLGQKALNDFQIYGQFQDFQINLDRKQIGKGYLKELPVINKNSRVQKSRSTSTLNGIEKIERTKYIDYLKELKTQRVEKGYQTEEQIKRILNTHKNREQAISELRNRIEKIDHQAKIKQQRLHQQNGIREKIDKNREVDELYLKSIKAKLACLEMKV